jgi:hypothetical protein
MGKLKDVKQEKFAVGLAQGLTQAESFRRAGYSAKSVTHASKVAHYPHVQERVTELVEEMTHRETRLTDARRAMLVSQAASAADIKTWLQLELVANIAMARDLGQIPAANKALEMIAKMNGIIRDEREGNNNAGAKTPNKELVPHDPQPETTINVQVLNRISGSPVGEGGESDPDQQLSILQRLQRVVPPDTNGRLERSASGVGRPHRTVSARVPRTVEAELVEEPELLRGVDDA